MRAVTAGVRTTADGATSRPSAAASPNVAIGQGITGQETTNETEWGVEHSRNNSAALWWRNTLIAIGILSCSAAGEQRRVKLP